VHDGHPGAYSEKVAVSSLEISGRLEGRIREGAEFFDNLFLGIGRGAKSEENERNENGIS
jgi:hypothetical protein